MTQRNPDIEIYLKRTEVEDVINWLNSNFTIGTSEQAGEATRILLTYEDRPLVCTVVPRAVKGGYTSVCFEPNNTPWDDDEACAIEAFSHFCVEVRCSTGGWTKDEPEGAEEADETDELDKGGWYRFTEDGRSVVNWLG